ncbi:MAG: DHHA1 domain-containing protein [archaeon]
MPDTLARMHTGEHIFFKSLENITGIRLDKIKLDETESSLYIFSERVRWSDVFEAEQKTNGIIHENLDVRTEDITIQDARERDDIRIKIERITSATVRLVHIGDYDHTACSGKHVANTTEVGGFLVTKFNSLGKDRWEIRFKVDISDDLFGLSRLARELLCALGTETDTALKAVVNLKKEVERLKAQVRSQAVDNEKEVVNGINLIHGEYEDYDSQLLIKQGNRQMSRKTVVCFLNKTEKGLSVMLMTSEDIGLDASVMLKKLTEEFGGRGGGKKNFAMGSVEADCGQVMDYVRNGIRS